MIEHGDLIKRESDFYIYDVESGWCCVGTDVDVALELQKRIYDADFE